MASTNNLLDETGTLVRLDPITGVGTAVAQLPGPVVSLAFFPSDGKLYGSIRVSGKFHLVTIDPQSGAINFIGIFRNAANPTIEYRVAAMGFDETGTLYIVHNLFGSQEDLLLRVDPATALATLVGSLGRPVRNMGGTLEDGVFYLLARLPPDDGGEVTLFTVDLTTGAATVVGGTGLFDNGVGLTTGGDGRLLAVVNHTLYEIDRATGASTLVGSTGFTVLSSLGFVDLVAQLCPCSGPPEGGTWGGHGEYVSCVARVTNDLRKAGVITGQEKGQLQAQAAQSDCGKP